MSPKKLAILVVVAVVALIAAWYINTANAPQTGVSAQAQPVLPELHEHVNDVNAITLTGAGDKVLATLKRGTDGWSIAEKSNYPADLAKIRAFLIKLDQATLTEAKTSNPKLYGELGVDETDGPHRSLVGPVLGDHRLLVLLQFQRGDLVDGRAPPEEIHEQVADVLLDGDGEGGRHGGSRFRVRPRRRPAPRRRPRR